MSPLSAELFENMFGAHVQINFCYPDVVMPESVLKRSGFLPQSPEWIWFSFCIGRSRLYSHGDPPEKIREGALKDSGKGRVLQFNGKDAGLHFWLLCGYENFIDPKRLTVFEERWKIPTVVEHADNFNGILGRKIKNRVGETGKRPAPQRSEFTPGGRPVFAKMGEGTEPPASNLKFVKETITEKRASFSNQIHDGFSDVLPGGGSPHQLFLCHDEQRACP